jgi:hypothetical protein
MKFPKRHLADSTLARIMIAARQTSSARNGAADSLELVELPPLGNTELAPPGAPQGAQQQQAAEQPPAELPPLESSGLDAGLVMQGADSFDAMTKGVSNEIA